MKILARYISFAFLRNFLLAIFSLGFLIFLQSILNQIFDEKYPVSQILFFQLLSLPRTVIEVAPPAVLMATVLTLSGLNRTHELVACHSIGVGVRHIMAVILSIVFMLCCLGLVLQDRILPPIFTKRTNYYWKEMRKKPDFFLDVKQDKIWYRSKNLIYNLRNFDPASQTIYGMAVYSFDPKFELSQVVHANRAQYDVSGWRLFDGTVTVFTKSGNLPLTKKFQEKELVIPERPKDFQEIEKRIDGLRLKELYQYIQRSKENGINTNSYEVTFYGKISLSFIPMIMALLAVPFSTRMRRAGGVGKDLVLCLGITIFYWIFYVVGLSLGKTGAIPPFLAAWIPTFIFGGILFILTLGAKRV